MEAWDPPQYPSPRPVIGPSPSGPVRSPPGMLSSFYFCGPAPRPGPFPFPCCWPAPPPRPVPPPGRVAPGLGPPWHGRWPRPVPGPLPCDPVPSPCGMTPSNPVVGKPLRQRPLLRPRRHPRQPGIASDGCGSWPATYAATTCSTSPARNAISCNPNAAACSASAPETAPHRIVRTPRPASTENFALPPSGSASST